MHIIYHIIVLAVSGNKYDLFENEDVTEKEGKEFAEQIGASFQFTSAKESIGIIPLFQEIAEKIYELKNQSALSETGKKRIKINSEDSKKKICC